METSGNTGDKMSFKLKKLHDWAYFFIPWIEEQNICHGFFTKASPSKIVRGENDQSFLKAFSLTEAIVMHQEHSDAIHIIENSERPTAGDAIILIQKRVAAIIKTADCLPIIISDLKYPMAAIAHAGWRGTAKRITEKVVKRMVKLGARREHMVALVGPAILSCCYEVKEDVYTIFKNKGFPETVFTRINDTLFLDLKDVNMKMLESSGIKEVYDINLCTCCNPHLFYSYRRKASEGRQINFVSLM